MWIMQQLHYELNVFTNANQKVLIEKRIVYILIEEKLQSMRGYIPRLSKLVELNIELRRVFFVGKFSHSILLDQLKQLFYLIVQGFKSMTDKPSIERKYTRISQTLLLMPLLCF